MNNKITSLSFRKDFQKPEEEKDRSLGFTKWGKKNDYPFFLVDLYNGSAYHQGIIKNKTFYIAGGGLQIVSGMVQPFIDNKWSDFDMNEIVGAHGKLAFSTFGVEPVVLTTAEGIQEFAIPHPPHVHQPLIQTVVDELNGVGQCPSKGESGARTSWVMDEMLKEYRRRTQEA